MPGESWRWDPSLYAGSAAYYARGRLPYPEALADALTAELGLDGSGRLLDIGCGPGSLTLLLANRFEQAIGIDADADMVSAARGHAAEAGIANTRWHCLRAEELPAGLGEFRLITFAQSFHWLDRPRVAAAALGMLTADGACAHVHATTHQGRADGPALPFPRPPHQEIAALVRDHLGEVRRAGQGSLPRGTAGGEDLVYRAAGFRGPRRIELPGRVVTRRADDLVAAVFSLSSSAPHLFGDRRAEFEADLRRLLRAAGPDGIFSEHTHPVAVDLWLP
ncbi:class I SAM-dependent methyltransferase [Crossiella cryophila]|uniref:SAM-dependent methyltransferase n=1 Tax=Crossiella cryophila TaxID=43355 RepID=A0A7W7CHZ6_9PSEU|nr:class I SAM-dependent methyltransferase [Crossiella cryophila]MBB4681583.1 SAM-dependent methyltransferase [Crossiella cryophila]